jgi:hypothetical protein
MNNHIFNKPAILLVCFLLNSSIYTDAQIYHQITNVSGTQVIGGENITITGINFPSSNTYCGAGPHYIGNTAGNNTTTGYGFSFSTPVEKIRFRITGTDVYEIFTLLVNNSFFYVLPSHLSPYGGTCNCPYSWILNAGRITVPATVGSVANIGFQIDISGLTMPGGISSVQIFDSVVSAGSVFSLYYLIDTAFTIRPFNDTLKCPGDSLKISYDVTHRLLAGNVFTAQLSDDNGYFPFPINIGILPSDTSGTINCYIPPSTPIGQGYRVRVISSSPSDTTIDNGKNIRISPFPDSINLSSNSPVCAADTIKFYASSTTSGTTYSWTGPGFNSTFQNPIIINATQTAAGDYIVTYSNYGCKIRDTITVALKPKPAKPVASSNTPVCPATNLYLSGSALANGVTRNWSGPGGFYATSQNANKNNITYSDAGSYIVTDTLNGCIAKDTEVVSVMITTPTPVASSNNPICLGGIINFTANNIAGANYNWTGPNNFFSIVQNAQRTNVTTTDAGTYYVTAKLNGCVSLPGNVTVSTIQGPTVSVYASPKDTICAGTNAALVSIPFGIGAQGATYEWYKNGTTTGITTGNYIVPNVNNGDIFYVQMLATGSVCTSPVQSNNVIITVLPATPPPAATITANPGTDIWPGLNVNFSISNLVNGGNNAGYQWMRNSKNITGATANKWSTTDLKDGDSICLMVTSSNQCAIPKNALSNCLGMKVPTNINPLNLPKGDLYFYPNPNNGNFTIVANGPGTLYICNMQGQEISSYKISGTSAHLNLQLQTGIYFGKFVTVKGNTVVQSIIVQ